MSTIIYRIETPEGRGMYHSQASEITSELQEPFKHPLPEDDDLLKEACMTIADNGGSINWIDLQDYHFGFSSIEQLRRWIYQDDWLRELANDGLVITVIESDDVLFGYTQAMFNGRISEQQHNILEFFNLP